MPFQITAGHLLLVALFTFVATSGLWLVVHRRARRHWEAQAAVAAGEALLRAEAMKFCPGCTRKLKKLSGGLAA